MGIEHVQDANINVSRHIAMCLSLVVLLDRYITSSPSFDDCAFQLVVEESPLIRASIVSATGDTPTGCISVGVYVSCVYRIVVCQIDFLGLFVLKFAISAHSFEKWQQHDVSVPRHVCGSWHTTIKEIFENIVLVSERVIVDIERRVVVIKMSQLFLFSFECFEFCGD